ncbi:lysoplasmalogenase family protein [Deinococcus radiotolerans]|uniref:YhhN family protein n=1 Tax=Deinococcus radiotolerans TaxID=1309407 RepID=A0ABQ2FHY4_9DEIO|nr:lysoplasmalogenase family protein [Deinococcus radiotolerans]GGK94940.1 hypothetical protein GCM10010844_11840 [Deinococcus radiotolerans]
MNLFLFTAGATVLAGLLDRPREHQLAEAALIATLATEVARDHAARPPRDTLTLLLALGAAALGGVTIARSTHQPHPRGNPRAFRGGAAWYALAQLLTVTLLWRCGARPHAGGWPARAAGLLLGAGLLIRHDPASLPVLSGYGALLNVMALLTADPRLAHEHPEAARLLRRGGWQFVASDLLILVRRSLLRGRLSRALTEGLMLALYAAAQRNLTQGLLRLTRRS